MIHSKIKKSRYITVNFMCEQYREKLNGNPRSATLVWNRLMHMARQHSADQQWYKSVVAYGNALDAAEIIFESTDIATETNRYLRTACELLYAVRCCDYPCDIPVFVAMIKKTLEENLQPANIYFLLRPLTDIAY